MPINKDAFKHIPEMLAILPLFIRRLIQGEYNAWFDNAVPSMGNTVEMPRELGTFSDDLAVASTRTTGYLRDLAVRAHASDYPISDEDGFYIDLYSRNSLPFHAITRGWDLQESYEGMDDALLSEYFRDREVGQATVDRLHQVLRAMPLLGPAEYDTSFWTNAYSGQMVFRGALTAPNTITQSNPGGSIYAYNSSISGDRVIAEGDIVTNTDFMSTSAVPSVAGEFVIRQVGINSDTSNIPSIVLDAWPRRVLFRIDMLTGRNITPWTELEQAEILFPLQSLFRVNSIEQSDYGLLVHLIELTSSEAANVHSAKNIMTGAVVDIDPKRLEN